jgi:DNA transformation protein
VALTPEFKDYICDLFSDLGPIEVKRMFGGAGIYAGGVFFAITGDGAIYVKADDLSEPEFQRAGSEPFTYATRAGESMVLRYWRLPEQAADDPAEAARWGRLGIDAALRAKAAKPRRKRA